MLVKIFSDKFFNLINVIKQFEDIDSQTAFNLTSSLETLGNVSLMVFESFPLNYSHKRNSII